MDPLRGPAQLPVDPCTLSRRSVDGGSVAANLAVALLAHGVPRAAAQEATPDATGGMPQGVTATPLTTIPIPEADVPEGGFTLGVARVTFEVGSAPPDSFAFTVYFDPDEAPVNHGISGPEFTFTGEMIAGKTTIGEPIGLAVVEQE
jgi:hypothetical protein